jgi:Notch-like protein
MFVGAKPCSSNPCQNGGTCYSDSVVFVCACPPNWTGPTCSIYETAIVTTTSSPGKFIMWRHASCKENHSCLFDCTFVVARPCSSNPCKNGATCYSDSVTFVCACPPGWTGSTCEFFQTVIITSTFTTPSGM